jgi:hypothetical protein
VNHAAPRPGIGVRYAVRGVELSFKGFSDPLR